MVHHKNRFFTLRAELGDGRAMPSSAQTVIAQIRSSVLDLHGDYGAGCTMPSLSVRFFDPSSSICAIRVDREFAEMVRTSIALVTQLDKREVRLRVLHMAGNMRSCKAVVRRQLDRHLRARLASKSALPVRKREEALHAHQEAVSELDRTQL
ncbi:hypothetical protein KFE25_009575 [Diacronema lutheri]|uniref:Uncharacterized protein n=1 Tax=Diacronema lutheri TaxID=2081491 RepID=A0A8J5Y5S3_DIALT|nr:hypothetical protein KFE25_009575 [Diacronema lutheri]